MPEAGGVISARRVAPTISVIVPCFNQGRYLPELLESVARATSAPHEVLVVNDGSTEPATNTLLKQLSARAGQQTLKIIQKPNGGLSSARNAGLKAAAGTYVQYLDADDLLYPDAIDFRADAMQRTDAGVALCDYVTCNEERTRFTTPEPTFPTDTFSFEVFAKRWERGVSIPIHCGLFRRSAIVAHEFSETLGAKEDWLFWMALAAAKTPFSYVARKGAVYRLHARSMTRDPRRMGVAWLQATGLARSSFADFDDDCVRSSLEHFNRFYLRHFWMSGGLKFSADFYDALLFGRTHGSGHRQWPLP